MIDTQVPFPILSKPPALAPQVVQGLNNYKYTRYHNLAQTLLADPTELAESLDNTAFRVMCLSSMLWHSHGASVLEETLRGAYEASFPAVSVAEPIAFNIRPACWPYEFGAVDTSGVEIPHLLSPYDLIKRSLARVGLPSFSKHTKARALAFFLHTSLTCP